MTKIQSTVPSHRLWSFALTCFGILALFGSSPVFSQSPVPTVTELAIASGGVSVSSVPQGSVLTLTATVTAGSDTVTAGQVLFCNASAPLCTDINQLGTAQITPAGTATLKTHLRLGIDTVKAVYLGTPNGATAYEGSSSGPLNITVVGVTSTRVTASGSSGSYTLTATVGDRHSLVRPTGTVSFLDTTNGNVILATAPLTNITEGDSTLSVPSTLFAQNNEDVVALTGDFNGDGNLDLVVQGDDNAIALGNGDGTFALSASFAAGIKPSLSGDFNNDGKLDLVAGNGPILLGNGDGTFSSGPNFPLSSTLVVGDFNNDGNLDVLGSDASGGLVMLLGHGDGTFTSVSLASMPHANGIAVAGDFNGDGKLDVALGTGPGSGVILLGNGDGTFTQGATLPGAPYAAADFNGDGKLDLLVGSNYLSVYLNNGYGTFTQGTDIEFYIYTNYSTVNSGPILVGDFNGDGIADIEFNFQLYDGQGPGCHVSALLGKGDGTFPPTLYFDYSNIDCATSSSLGDMDGDGVSDFIINSSYGCPGHDFCYAFPLTAVLNQPAAFPATATVTGVAVPGTGSHAVEASYSGDAAYAGSISSPVLLTATTPAAPPVFSPGGGSYSRAQTVTITEASTGTSIYYTTDGTIPTPSSTLYTGPVPIAYSTTLQAIAYGGTYGPSPIASADYAIQTTTANLALSGPDPYTLTCTVKGTSIGGVGGPTGSVTFTDSASSVPLGSASLGASTLGPDFDPPVSFPVGSAGPLWLSGDFNGDGIPDLLLSAGGTIEIMWGQGGGTFLAPIASASVDFTSVVAGDFNTDGKLDLVVSNAGDDSVSILLGNGDGTFSAERRLTSGDSVVTGDFDGDGKLDIAVADSVNNTVSILLSNGDGTFKTPVSYSSGNAPHMKVSGHFHGGSAPLDLVVSDADGLTLLAGNGDGTFQAQQTVAAGIDGLVTTADFNQDGKPDLAVAGISNQKVTVLLGNGDGTFQYSPQLVTTGLPATSAIASGDFNGDGVPDVAIGAEQTSILLLYGKGDGTFSSRANLSTPNAVTGLVVSDFTGEGYADLAYSTTAGISVTLNVKRDSATAFLSNVPIDTAVANHDLQCSYAGDANYAPSLSNVISQTYTAAAAPVFSLLTGDYPASQPVSITATGPTAIYYTTDGSTPTTASTLYTASFTVTSSITLKAINVPPGYQASTVSEAVYNIAAAPQIAFSGQTATITDSTSGAVIYYTTDGSSPSTKSTKYTAPFTLSQTTTVKSFATAAGYINSPAASATLNLGVPPTLTATPSALSIFKSQALSVTIVVGAVSGKATPTGSVALTSGSYSSASATLASGQATINIPAGSLVVGNATLTVTYTPDTAGSSVYSSATGSATVTVIEDFTVGPPSGGSTTATTTPGGNATYSLVLTPASGETFSAAIDLTVTGLPAGATATFSPAIVPVGAGATPVTLTVNVPVTASMLPPGEPFGSMPMALGLIVLPLAIIRRKRLTGLGKTAWLILLATIGTLAIAGLIGCGGGGGSQSTPPPQSQTYTLTVTATSGSLSNSTSLTLTVN